MSRGASVSRLVLALFRAVRGKCLTAKILEPETNALDGRRCIRRFGKSRFSIVSTISIFDASENVSSLSERGGKGGRGI